MRTFSDPGPPRLELALLPTPCHRLPRLSDRLGFDLWIKRDDLTGLALGGNKARKLEYLLPQALAANADVVVTCGSAQSNFIRQLAAACAMLGLECAAAVMKLPYEHARPAGEALADVNGNLALDQILGAQLEWQPDGTWDVLFQAAEALAGRLESQGKRVYRIPVGGSSPLGAYAFARAGEELVRQVKPDFLVTASSSGSTHTGLAAYFSGSKTQVIGIACDPEPEIVDDYSELSGQLAKLEPSLPALRPQDFRLESGYVGGGYGISSSSGNAAIETMARTEGIFLDPIYSGKAFAGLLDLAKKGVLRGTVVFWHTGGVPALFATEV